MAGLFGTNVCNSLFFQMQCDIYYATESQDNYGKIDKRWTFDMTEPCSFYTLGDMSNNNNFSFEDEKFYKLETMLYGRFATDPRQDSSGLYHPLSHILVSNIRGATCNEETFFIESNGDYAGKPTIFEIKTCQPFIGPFNTVEYYKIQLERSDTQELNQSVNC
jgi:hypothetical protein